MTSVVVSGIKKAFGAVVALRDISFEVRPGEVVGFLGPNGAGKTTMVDILSTLTLPDEGRAWVAGHDVVDDPDGVRRSIMLTGQQVAVDNLLTGEQNLVMMGRLHGLRKSAARARARELDHGFRSSGCGGPAYATYSGGDATSHRRRVRVGGFATSAFLG